MLEFASQENGQSNERTFPFLLLPGYYWEDEIDIANVKSNRNKVWVCLMTIGIPEKKIHTSTNTYILSLGPADKNHDNVEKFIAQEFVKIAKIQNFYFGKWKLAVPTISLIYSIQADRPAKARGTRTLAGNSKYHARFGWVGDLDSVRSDLVSCKKCLRNRISKILTHDQDPSFVCSTCHDWEFDGLSYRTPQNYPTLGGAQPPPLPFAHKWWRNICS